MRRVPVSGPALALALALAALVVPGAVQATVWHVLPDGTGDFPTIQDAVDAAVPGDSVVLGNGTFTGPGNHRIRVGKAITLRGADDGGQPSVIDCESQGRGMILTAPAVVEGITIRNGLSLSFFEDPYYFGGAMMISDDPIVRRCVIEDCRGDDTIIWGQGAGVDVFYGSPTFEDCVFRNNSFTYGSGNGAAMHVTGGSVQVIRCSFTNNTAVSGGAIAAYECSLTVEDCAFDGNLAVEGAGIYASTWGWPESEPGWFSIRGTRFSGNARTTVGGARGSGLYVNTDVTGEVISCTFGGNRGWFGGGIEVHDAITVERTILWGNCASEGAAVYVGATGSVEFGCSDVDPVDVGGPGAVTFGPGNVSADPLFCDPLPCAAAPTAAGIYDVDASSIVLDVPGCGRIGAGDAGCTSVGVPAIAEASAGTLLATPNPFGAATTIRFSLPAPAEISLTIHDVAGRRVRQLDEGRRDAGTHAVSWDGTDDSGARLASGIYFASVSAGDRRMHRRLVLLR